MPIVISKYNRKGRLPLQTYWLVRRRADELAALASTGAGSVAIGKELGVAPQTVQAAVDFINQNEELVARKDWDQVEDVMFAKQPNFRALADYKNHVAAGYDAYVAAIASTNKGGRKKGVSYGPRKPKAPSPEEQGRGVIPQAPVVAIVTPTSPPQTVPGGSTANAPSVLTVTSAPVSSPAPISASNSPASTLPPAAPARPSLFAKNQSPPLAAQGPVVARS